MNGNTRGWRNTSVAIGLLTPAFALGTAVFGWWSVPLIGLLFGLVARIDRPALAAGLSAGLAWACLLGWIALAGAPLGPLAERFGAILSLPGHSALALPVLFAGLLGVPAAALPAAFRRQS